MRHIFLLFLILFSARLQAQPFKFIIGLEDANNSPYESIQNGQPTGFHIDLIETVAQQLHWKPTWRALPWNRALKELELGDIAAVSYISINEERKKFTTFEAGNELHRSEVCFVIRKQDQNRIHFDGTWNSVKNFRIGKPIGYWFSKDFENAQKNLKITEFNGTGSQAMDMLLLKRIDIYVSSNSDSNLVDSNPELLRLNPCFMGDTRYIGFSKKYSTQAKEFAQAMKSFRKTKAYKDLCTKYHIKPIED